MKRLIVAIEQTTEGTNYYLRKTLSVTHNGNTGEVVYYTKPFKIKGDAHYDVDASIGSLIQSLRRSGVLKGE